MRHPHSRPPPFPPPPGKSGYGAERSRPTPDHGAAPACIEPPIRRPARLPTSPPPGSAPLCVSTRWTSPQVRATATTYTHGLLVSLAKVASLGGPTPRQSPSRSTWLTSPSRKVSVPFRTHST